MRTGRGVNWTMDAESRFFRAVQERINRGGVSVSEATRSVVRDDPILHTEYLIEVNQRRGRDKNVAQLETRLAMLKNGQLNT